MPGRLTNEQPRWSPDGKRVLFTTGSQRIYVLDLPDARPRFLAYGHDPEWSPDGRQVAFLRRGRHWQLALVRADGSHEAPLATLRNGMRGRLAWEPQGRMLVGTDLEGQPFSVDSGDGCISPAGFEGPARLLAWAPGGRWLAFTRPASQGNSSAGLYVCHWEDRRTSLLAPVQVPIAGLCWSRDGQLLFALTSEPEHEILCCDPLRGCVLRIPALADAHPLAPSPSGEELLYCASKVPGDLLVGDIHGIRLRPFAHGYGPTWSPDGEWVAFFDGPDEEGSLCAQRRNGANFARWLPHPPMPPLRERIAEALTRGSILALFPGVPAAVATAATAPFLALHGLGPSAGVFAAWSLFFALYRGGLHQFREGIRSFVGTRGEHAVAVLPAAALGSLASLSALELSPAWLAPLAAGWLALCAFAAPAVARARPASRRALAAAWAFALLGASTAGVIHTHARATAANPELGSRTLIATPQSTQDADSDDQESLPGVGARLVR